LAKPLADEQKRRLFPSREYAGFGHSQDAPSAQLVCPLTSIRFAFYPYGQLLINQVERWFAKITTQAIRRGNFRSVKHGVTARNGNLRTLVRRETAQRVKGESPQQ
jgi:hypothetical protein